MPILRKNRVMPYLVGLLSLIMLVLGWVGYASVNRVAQVTEDLYNHPLVVSTAVLRIHANVISLNRLMKDVLLAASPEEINQYNQVMDYTETEIVNDFTLVKERFLGAPVLVQEATLAFSRVRPIRDEVVRLSLEGRQKEAAAFLQTVGSQNLMDVETKINNVRNFSRTKAQTFFADAKETRSQTLWLLVISLGAGIVLAGFISRRAIRLETNLQEQNEHLDSTVQGRTSELAAVNEELIAQNEEITALNEELTTQNEEITALNQELEGMNEELEQRVAERTVEVTAAHHELVAQFEELCESQETARRSAAIKDVLREIAEAAIRASSLDELYQTVHCLVKKVLSVKMVHIALLDKAANQIVVPYCVDETNSVPRQRQVGKGVTEYIMRMGRTLHINPAEFERLYASGEISLKYMPVNDWLQAPLVDSHGVIFGVIALNSLGATQSFQPEDAEVLSIIATQVSLAIERKQAEIELAILCNKAEEASIAKSRFLANMSHEFRTPLNAIIGFTEVLKDKLFGPLNKKQDKYVTDVLTSAQHLLSLVTDILDLSKIEAGKMELERSLINIKEICQNSLDLFRDKTTRREVRLSFTLDAAVEGIALYADERKIRQILYNLIDNAIKFNKPGGSISVTMNKADGGSKPGAIRIVVEDTGIGITREGLARLFKPFNQLSRTHTEQAEGSGLGLALTKHLVELHGGEIFVESEFGKGSQFIVLIPIQGEHAG